MKISKLILQNFRSFKAKTEINFDDLTAIIGQNDLGKSTILEAIDIFVNDKDGAVKIDADDANKSSGSEEVSIGVVFSDFPDKVDIDEGNETSLTDEFLLNRDGLLEIHKHYKNAKCTGVFIRANHPTADAVKDLLLKKRQELKKIVEDNNYECENKTKNAYLRKAIRENCDDLTLADTDIPANDEDAKKIWLKLENYLPVYALFQSDRPNKDDDHEVQDPMRLAIKEILQQEDLKIKFIEIAKEVETISKEIAKKTLEKLAEINPEIAHELNPIIPPAEELRWESVFKNIEITSDNGVPLNKRGSGVRRLVLLNFFRARAEETREKGSKSNVIYAIEEPETSQHPNHQKILIDALKNLSSHEGRQIFITTHSPSLVQLLPSKNIRLLRKANGKIELVGGDLAISEIIDDLGVLPQIEKVAVFVEGENDRNFLIGINTAIVDLKNIVDLNKISIIPLGGSSLEKWVNRNYLDGSNIIEFHLYDKDCDEKYKSSIEKINDRHDLSAGKLTIKLEIENYIHPALIESFDRFKGISFSTIMKNWDNEDIPKYIKDHLPLYDTSMLQGAEKSKRDSDYEIEIKNILNGALSKNMSKKMLEEIGAWDEIKGWFEKIKELCKQTTNVPAEQAL